MRKRISARQVNENNKKYATYIDWFIAILLAVLSVISILVAIRPISIGQQKSINIPDKVVFCISFVIVVLITALYIERFRLFRKGNVTELNYIREKKLNEIHESVFAALSDVNSAKTREVLRYTYGTVPEWNPIDYTKNVMLYDVHEQIRSILISIKQVVISIDPTRFNDKNVSVELVYCYPKEASQYGELPILEGSGTEGKDDNEERPWRLISSGDLSGNHSRVVRYLSEVNSFYTVVDSCGTKFANNKYGPILDSREINKIKEHLLEVGMDQSNLRFAQLGAKCFIQDTKDMEFSKKGILKGSAIGSVVCVRNDNPEETFIKAILTINTYGESLHVPVEKKESRLGRNKKSTLDKDGLEESDFKDLFLNNIIGTYSTLLASELVQMYVRHSIQKGNICPHTGRKTDEPDKRRTLKISYCQQCDNSKCERNPSKQIGT